MICSIENYNLIKNTNAETQSARINISAFVRDRLADKPQALKIVIIEEDDEVTPELMIEAIKRLERIMELRAELEVLTKQ